MGKPYIDLSNQRFHNLIVISYNSHKHKSIFWNCICDCGGKGVFSSSALRANRAKRCGVCSKKHSIQKKTKHGMSHSNIYYSWTGMISRCYDKNIISYKNYGGRGIIVCDRWKDKETGFIDFLSDMGPRPTLQHSIDRIDNNGNYEPSNCRWATRKEQSNNRRINRMITYCGEKKTASEWSNIVNITAETLYKRTKRGWSDEKTIETPININKKRNKKTKNIESKT